MTQENKTTVVITMDQEELACRIAEACVGCARPEGVTARQALSVCDEESRRGFYNAAVAAMKYLSECAGNFGRAELVPPGKNN